MDDRLYSVKGAAEFLGGLSVFTIRAWLSQGRLRPTKIGRRTMIRKSELQRIISNGEKASSHRFAVQQ